MTVATDGGRYVLPTGRTLTIPTQRTRTLSLTFTRPPGRADWTAPEVSLAGGPALSEQVTLACNEAGHSDGGGHALGQRPQIHDVPVLVACRKGDYVLVDAEIMGPVVLDQEYAVPLHDIQHSLAQLRGPMRAGGVGEMRLCVERSSSRLRQCAIEVLGVRPMRAAGDRDETDTNLRGS